VGGTSLKEGEFVFFFLVLNGGSLENNQGRYSNQL